MHSNGPRYEWSAVAAAEIVNIHLGADVPKPVLYSRILYTILQAMYKAEDELRSARLEPCEN